MPLVIKPSGSISYTEINTAVVNGGGFATASFNGLNAQAYTLTNSSVYLPPDKFSEFVGTSGNVFTFADWTGTVSVSSLGAVTFTIGNAVSVSVTPTSYALVGTDTSRTISVSIVVPTGFSNAGATLTGTKTAIQPARNFTFADWTGGISINQDGVVSSTLGNAAAVSFTPSSFAVVSTDTSRTVSVTLTAPTGYFNAGVVLAAVNVTVTQPAKLFTYAMWTGVLSVSCDGVISATTGNAATPITFSPTSYPEVDVDTERKPSITITVPSGYGNSGQTITDTTGIKSAIQPKKFLTTTWTGAVSINKNTGEVSATTGNAASIQSITPSSVALVTTPTNRSITVVIVIPSGYCNSGTLSITKTVSQAAADETINITIAGSHNTWFPSGQGDAASLSISTVSVWNTNWTIEVSDSAWIYLEDGIYTGTGNATKMIAVQPNYFGSPGFNGSTRYGSVRVYKTGAYGLIYDIVNIQQAVGTPPVIKPTFTMSGKTHTFAWNAGLGNYHTITVSNFGGSLMTNGTFSMISNDFVLYDIDAHVTVSEDNPGDWVGTITNFAQASYSIGVYPKANNTSTTNTKTATIQFDASNSSGTSTDTATVTQSVSPPTFTIGDANVTGFAVAQNGAVTAPQAAVGTITNRSYSSGFSGGSYPRVNVNTQRSVVVTVQVPGGYSNSGNTVSGTFFATQLASPTFTFGDAGVTGFAVDANGNITAPNATNATITNVTYNGSINNTSYSIVNTPTNRTATVSIQAPAGYFNSGEIISSDVSTTQPQTDTFTFTTANVTGFAVAQDGFVTEPTAQYGVISNRIYSSGYNDGYYPIVNQTTQRSVYVVVNVPNGYYNSGQTVDGTLYADQASTPTFTFGDWNGSVSVGINGVVSFSTGNASFVSVSPTSYPVIYGDPVDRTISVTIYAPSGYYNTGVPIGGTKTASQPAEPIITDPTVTIYTQCNNSSVNYFIEGNYSYPYIEINAYCMYYAETTVRSVAVSGGFQEFFSIFPSSCDCG
jgi:hypothetical protein